MKKIRTVAVFPTMFTLGNLVCGFFAIVVAARVDVPISVDVPHGEKISFRAADRKAEFLDKTDDVHNIMLAGLLIFAAMVFDALDGYIARLASVSSQFGAELDSLCDLVTFGVAPGFLLVKMCPRFEFLHSEAVWIIAASFAVCAALRLARFNVETEDDDDHMHFSGLPSPAAAGTVAAFAILFYTLRVDTSGDPLLIPDRLFGWELYAVDVDRALQTILPVFAVMLGLLMVSRVPYPHVLNLLLRGDRSFGHIVGLVFALAALMLIGRYSILIVWTSFVLGPPIMFAWRRLVQRRTQQEEPLF